MENTIGKRITELRKTLGLTQQEFADKIGCSRSAIGKYEIGQNIPLDPIITAICREFNVSETWLREGTGPMLIPVTPDQEMAQAWGRMISGRDDGADDRKVFMQMLMALTPEQLTAVKEVILEMAKRFEESP